MWISLADSIHKIFLIIVKYLTSNPVCHELQLCYCNRKHFQFFNCQFVTLLTFVFIHCLSSIALCLLFLSSSHNPLVNLHLHYPSSRAVGLTPYWSQSSALPGIQLLLFSRTIPGRVLHVPTVCTSSVTDRL